MSADPWQDGAGWAGPPSDPSPAEMSASMLAIVRAFERTRALVVLDVMHTRCSALGGDQRTRAEGGASVCESLGLITHAEYLDYVQKLHRCPGHFPGQTVCTYCGSKREWVTR